MPEITAVAPKPSFARIRAEAQLAPGNPEVSKDLIQTEAERIVSAEQRRLADVARTAVNGQESADEALREIAGEQQLPGEANADWRKKLGIADSSGFQTFIKNQAEQRERDTRDALARVDESGNLVAEVNLSLIQEQETPEFKTQIDNLSNLVKISEGIFSYPRPDLRRLDPEQLKANNGRIEDELLILKEIISDAPEEDNSWSRRRSNRAGGKLDQATREHLVSSLIEMGQSDSLHDLAELVRNGWSFQYRAEGNSPKTFSIDFDNLPEQIQRAKVIQQRIDSNGEQSLTVLRDLNCGPDINPNRFLTLDRVEALEKIGSPDSNAILDRLKYLAEHTKTTNGDPDTEYFIEGLWLDNEHGLQINEKRMAQKVSYEEELHGFSIDRLPDPYERATWKLFTMLTKDRMRDSFIDKQALFRNEWSLHQISSVLQYGHDRGDAIEVAAELTSTPQVLEALPPNEQQLWRNLLESTPQVQDELRACIRDEIVDEVRLKVILAENHIKDAPQVSLLLDEKLPEQLREFKNVLLVEVLTRENPLNSWNQIEEVFTQNQEFWATFPELPPKVQALLLETIAGSGAFDPRMLGDIAEVKGINQDPFLAEEKIELQCLELIKLFDSRTAEGINLLDFNDLLNTLGTSYNKETHPGGDSTQLDNQKPIFAAIYQLTDIYRYPVDEQSVQKGKAEGIQAIRLMDNLSDPMLRSLAGIRILDFLSDPDFGDQAVARSFLEQLPNDSLRKKLELMQEARAARVARGETRYDEVIDNLKKTSTQALERIKWKLRLFPEQSEPLSYEHMLATDIQSKGEKLRETMKVSVNLNYDALEKFFKDGSFKTARDLGSQNGGRDLTEKIFGIRAKGTEDDPNPVSGAVWSENGTDEVKGAADGYGDTFIVLKNDRVANRTIFTYDDSLASAGAMLWPEAAYAKAIKNSGKNMGLSPYVEALILGGVKPEDVESVNITTTIRIYQRPDIQRQIEEWRELHPEIQFNILGV